jgi:ABC-type phosphate/phosphonate transport system substrate-binding protein
VTLTLVPLLGANVDEATADLAAHLSASGTEARFDSEWSPAHRMDLVRSGVADIAWMCGLLALELDAAGDIAADLVAAPVFEGETDATYRAVIVTRSPASGLAELCTPGVAWAMNEPISWSGHRALLAECALRELQPPATIVWSGSHLASIRMVAGGDADAAAIDSTVWRWAGVADLEVVDETRPWPSPPLLMRSRLRARMPQLAGLIADAGPMRGVDRLQPADWGHLDPIRSSVGL